MAENQILPFAVQDTGTNLLTQAEYAADAQRLAGHQPGVARSKLENKALRQCSALAAGLAQFIADGQADDVTDAKTPAEIAAMLLAANTAQMPTATETTAGKVRLATAAEAAGLTSGEVAIPPAAMQQILVGSFTGSNGYIRIKTTGGNILLQTQRVILDSGQTKVTLPLAFAGSNYGCIAGFNHVALISTVNQPTLTVVPSSPTQVTVSMRAEQAYSIVIFTFGAA